MPSKASEWASASCRRYVALEVARQRIEREMGTDKPGPRFSHDLLQAEVIWRQSGDTPEGEALLRIRPRTASASIDLSADEALALSRWIFDMFGEEPQIKPPSGPEV